MINSTFIQLKRTLWMLFLCFVANAANAENGDLFTQTVDGYTLTFKIINEDSTTCEAVSVKDLGEKELRVPLTAVRYEDDPEHDNITYDVVMKNTYTELDYKGEEHIYYVIFDVLSDAYGLCEIREVGNPHYYYPASIKSVNRKIYNEDTGTYISKTFGVYFSSTTEDGGLIVYEPYEEFFVPKYVSSEECIPAIPTNVKPSYYYNGEETEIGYKTVVMTNSDNLGMTFIYMVTDEEQKTCGVRSYKNSHEGTVTIPSNVERSVLNLETGDMITTDFTVTRIMGGGKHGNYWGALRCAQMDTLELPKTIDTYDIFCCCETYNIITVISHRPCATYMHGSAFSSSMEKWVDDDTFNSLYLRSTLHVPFGSYDSYFWTTSWYRFSRIIEGIGDMTLEEPVATLEEGTYDVPQTVQLTNPNGRGDIYYYYVNDSHPLIWNDEYGGSVGDVQKYNNEEIPIDMTTTLVAIVMDGDEISNVIRKEYTITEEALSVCGVKINNANANDVLGDGTVSYSKDTERVLTLNNATLDPAAMKESTGLEVWGGSLVVKLVGNNKILGTEYGISMGLDNGKGGEYFGGNTLVITGEGDNATLEIDGGYVGLLSYCSNVHIENCTVKILNSSTGIYTKAGGKGDGELDIVDATLEIQAETTASEGLLGLNLSGVSILSPENAEFVPSEIGDIIKKGDKEEDYDMEPTGNFYADGVLLTNIVIGPSGSTGDDVATCIKDVNANEKHSPIYTLQGIRIEKPQKNGMYIKNGKKFVIK